MSQPTVAGQVLELTLQAAQGTWVGKFDQLEVWRSTSGAAGPYTELTAVSWQVPTFPSDLYEAVAPSPALSGPLAAVGGLALDIISDEMVDLSMIFDGSGLVSLGDIATEIGEKSNQVLTAFVWTDGRLVVRGKEPGSAAILRVAGGDAAPLLGLATEPPDSVAYGRDARISLIANVDSYSFTDAHGDPSYFYKTRYRQASTGKVSNFSSAFSACLPASSPSSALILGTLDLVDAQGRPVQNREVAISVKFGGSVVGSAAVIPRDISKLTDSRGHVEFQLLRGLLVSVAVAGTQLVRDVTVPTDPSLHTFNLLDPAVGSNDVFTVQVPDIDYAVRRHL